MLHEELINRVIELERELAKSKAEYECLKADHDRLAYGVRRIQLELEDKWHSAETSCNIISGMCVALLEN